MQHDFVYDSLQLWKRHKWSLVLVGCVFILIVCYILSNTSSSKKLNTYSSDSKLDELINTLKSKKKSSGLKYESKCRQIMEKIFKKPFKSCRPNWLKNPKTKRNLELDCYNDELKLALEYQGVQHANFSYFYHRTQDVFLQQIWRDKLKKQMCLEHGVTLITVPHTIEFDQLEQYIVYELQKLFKSSQ